MEDTSFLQSFLEAKINHYMPFVDVTFRFFNILFAFNGKEFMVLSLGHNILQVEEKSCMSLENHESV